MRGWLLNKRQNMTDRYDTSHLPENQFQPGFNGLVLRNKLGMSHPKEATP
jgi:hypothetical protein